MEQWIKNALFEASELYSDRAILWILTAVVFIYVFVAVPCGYAFLKRREKISYLREFIVASALLFSAIIFVVGARTRITAPTFTYIRVINEGDVNTETVYASVQLPYKQSEDLNFVHGYNLVTDNEVVKGYADPEYAKIISQINGKNETVLIHVENTAVLSPEYVELQKKAATKKVITATAEETEDGYFVNIENLSEHEIVSAILVDDGKYFEAGTLTDSQCTFSAQIIPDELMKGIYENADSAGNVLLILEISAPAEDVLVDTSAWDVFGHTYAIVECQEGK